MNVFLEKTPIDFTPAGKMSLPLSFEQKLCLINIVDNNRPPLHLSIVPFEIFWKKHKNKRREVGEQYMKIWLENLKSCLSDAMKDIHVTEGNKDTNKHYLDIIDFVIASI